MAGYAVTRRSADGRAQEIACTTHAGCTWTMPSAGARSDDDPVFTMQFARHLELAAERSPTAFGHLRRSRAKPGSR
jgi:hypothetical protein